MVRGRTSVSGFTLIEVLIAMAITALISMVAYTGLSSALSGAERSTSKPMSRMRCTIVP